MKACINTFKPLFSPSCNWRFAPKLSDIRNQMYRATITCRLSRIDQENVSSKVDQWKSRYDLEKLYFRPHLHEDTHENDVQQNSEIDSEMKDEGTEESVYLTRHRKSRDGKTLLFVHQTTWQRQLLKIYADVHCMLVRRYILNHQVPLRPLVLCCSEDKCGLPNSGIFCHSR